MPRHQRPNRLTLLQPSNPITPGAMMEGSTPFRILRRGLLVALAFALTTAWTASAQIHRTIEELGPSDIAKSQRQRERAAQLARRYMGTPLHGSELRDLKTIQRLLDRGFIKKENVADQQDLGLVLGDVMVANLNLQWIVIDDQLGRSRALRWQDTQPIFFPITMFSKRIAAGEKVDVRALYDRVAKDVKKLQTSYR